MKTTKQYILAFVFSTVLVGCKKADMISPKPASSPVVQSLSSSSEASTLSDQDERIKTWIEAEKCKLGKWYKAEYDSYSSVADFFRTYKKKNLCSDQYQARLTYLNQCAGLSTSPYSYKYKDPSTGLLSFEQYMVKLNGTLSAVQSYINYITQASRNVSGRYYMENLKLHEEFVLMLQPLKDVLKDVRAWSDLDLSTLNKFKKNCGLHLFLTNKVCSNGPGSEHRDFWFVLQKEDESLIYPTNNGRELPIHEQRMDYVQWKGDFDRRFDAFKKSL